MMREPAFKLLPRPQPMPLAGKRVLVLGLGDSGLSVARWVERQKIALGLLTVYIPHTSASLLIQENADPDVPRDMLHALRTLIPQHGMGFRHGEENSDAHIKASLIGPSVTIPFKDGELLLGRWQGIFLCEFDGGRERKVIMMIR